MFAIQPKAPSNLTSTRRAPRIKQPRYVYTEGCGETIKDIVLSIVNGIGIEAVDPALFPQLIGPLNQEIPRLERYRNYSAIKQVDLALEFIQNYLEPPIQLEESKEPSRQEIFYSKHRITKLVNDAMNGKKLPVMPPKMRKMVMEELNEIAHNSENDSETRQAEHVLFQLATPKKRLLQPIEENTTDNVTIEEQIEKIKTNLQRDLNKNEAEKNAELSKLKLTRDAQLNLVNQYIAHNPPKDMNIKKSVAEINELKSKEQYYIATNKFAQADKIRTKISQIQEQDKAEAELRWQTELEKQRRLIEKNYTEKHQMKIKCYKNRARLLRAEATKQINKLIELQTLHVKRAGKVHTARSLPKLNPRKQAEVSLIRQSSNQFY